MNLPIVLVASEGDITPEEIITNIRKISIENDLETIDKDTNTIGYKYHLVTKYYETDIIFSPLTCPLQSYPAHLKNYLEGALIYFNANEREFLKSIPIYANFLKNNQIELGILLCNELFDEIENGITYKEAKQCSKLLDVIELGRVREDDEEDNPHDPIGYDELLQAIRSFLWSNVNVHNAFGRQNHYDKLLESGGGGGVDKDDDSDTTFGDSLRQSKGQEANGSTSELTASSILNSVADKSDPQPEQSESDLEAELAGFERLLSEVKQFRNTTANWTRNEKLAYAEEFASFFEELIGDDSFDPESNDDHK